MILEARPLSIFGVYDRGVPTQERIVLYASAPVSLREYAVGLGIRQPMDFFIPIPDCFFWLGDTAMAEPGWVFIYTGRGQRSVTRETHSGLAVQALYWGREQVVLASADVIPVVYRFDQVLIGNGPNRSMMEVPEFAQKLLANTAFSLTK